MSSFRYDDEVLLLELQQNLPAPLLYSIGSQLNVPISRVGDFHEDRTGPGCGSTCIWNGAGYYADAFICGETYPSALTFYCSTDCYRQVGETKRVFLSYRWSDSAIADHVTRFCMGAGIQILRDVRQIDVLDSISAFMDTAAASRYVVIILGESYFFSRYCLYEFLQLCDSDLEIRTIPIVLGGAASDNSQDRYERYWRDAYRELAESIATVEPRHSSYLDTEISLLREAPGHIARFLSEYRASGLPDGGWWLSWNCRYLIGAITTTFQPSGAEATNWTFSSPRVSGAPGEELPLTVPWTPGPCHVHGHSRSLADAIMTLPWNRSLVRSASDEHSTIAPEPGVHVVLLDESFLLSLPLCVRLLKLRARPDVELVPIFLDPALTKPLSEVKILQEWSERFRSPTLTPVERNELDDLLTKLGPLVTECRDRLVPVHPMRPTAT